MSRVAVVGAGAIGSAFALAAAERGHHVLVLERDERPRGASVRNFGLVWICGRAGGRELELALAGRERWRELAARAPSIGFRETGSLVVACDEAEEALLGAACGRDDAHVRRFALLAPDEARRVEPALAGSFRAALHSPLDAVVEPAPALAALQALAEAAGASFRFGRPVLELDLEADLMVLCTGDRTDLLPAREGLVRRRLQMLAAAGPRLTTAVADGDALRYYPAFALPERDALAPPAEAVTRFGAQLLVAPRADGTLTVGDTHVDDAPGAFGADEDAYDHLLSRFERLFAATPRVLRRWTGSYLRRNDGEVLLREEVAPGVVALTAVGGLGMTAAPAIAAETVEALGL